MICSSAWCISIVIVTVSFASRLCASVNFDVVVGICMRDYILIAVFVLVSYVYDKFKS